MTGAAITLDEIRPSGIPESWDCVDCGYNTAPGNLMRPRSQKCSRWGAPRACTLMSDARFIRLSLLSGRSRVWSPMAAVSDWLP
jgi:hypothetical protein